MHSYLLNWMKILVILKGSSIEDPPGSDAEADIDPELDNQLVVKWDSDGDNIASFVSDAEKCARI
jgi:hypothetical protein